MGSFIKEGMMKLKGFYKHFSWNTFRLRLASFAMALVLLGLLGRLQPNLIFASSLIWIDPANPSINTSSKVATATEISDDTYGIDYINLADCLKVISNSNIQNLDEG
jgi:hypothetical protein